MVRSLVLMGRPARRSLYLGLRARGLQTIASERPVRPRSFRTLGIETSCDDTCVAVLQTNERGTTVMWNARVPCANKKYEGIHPLEAVESHTRNLPKLIQQALPHVGRDHSQRFAPLDDLQQEARRSRVTLYRPDLIAVTRGPGMKACLSIGISMAKALSVALAAPLIGVHHMQAHALTPQLESALERSRGQNVGSGPGPQYPFLTLLVSGGHTMLVHTTSNINHRILASTQRGSTEPREKASPVAIGDMLDKCARAILPDNVIPGDEEVVVYAKLMEAFVLNSKYNGLMHMAYEAPGKRQDEIEIYQSEAGWAIPPPLRLSREMKYDFSGLGGMIRSIMQDRPDMSRDGRAELAYHTMRLSFEHLASRVILALQNDAELLANPPRHLVLSGGVASNKFLRRVLQSVLKARGFGDVQVTAPAPTLCTDNAAMIAWTGAEMFQSGWMTDDAFLPKSEWPIEQIITGTDCWIRRPDFAPVEVEQGKDADGQQGMAGEQSPPTVAAARAPAGPEPDAASNEPSEPAEPAEPAAGKDRSNDRSSTSQLTPDSPVEPKQEGGRKKRKASKADLKETSKQKEGELSKQEETKSSKQEEAGPPKKEEAKSSKKEKAGASKQGKADPPKQEKAKSSKKEKAESLKKEEAGASKQEKAGPPEQEEAGLSNVERLQRIQQRLQQLLDPPSAGKEAKAKGGSPPPAPEPERRSVPPAPLRPRPAAVGKPKQQAESAQDELVAAEGRLGGTWVQQAPPEQPGGAGEDRPSKASHTQQQQTASGEKIADRGHDKGSAQMPSPWPRVVRNSKDREARKHVVRLLRPLQPLAEAEAEPEPKVEPAAAMGPLRKGLSALRKWAGL